jgi:predicted RNA polymerase sigma factor
MSGRSTEQIREWLHSLYRVDSRRVVATLIRLCRRLGRIAEARSSYEKALTLAQQEPERKFLQERLRRLN